MPTNRNITVITANYYPEDTAIGLYTTQFSKFLQKKNYNVTVITGFPYYPQWEIYKDYKKLPRSFEETIDGIKIIRYKQYVPEKINLKGRVFMMLSFFLGTLKNSSKIPNSDLIICIIPYTLSTFPAAILAKRKKAKLWIHIQDFEFDLAFDSGIVKKKNIFTRLFIKCLAVFETKMLNKATIVSSISYNMLGKIKNKSNHTMPYYFPNWVSSEKINPASHIHHPYINKDKFTLLYSGNIGEKQDWNFLKRLCKKINLEENIDIVIVGSGSYKKTLINDLKQFSFVRFFNPIPFDDLNNLLCSADIHFLFQKIDVVDTIMPSKILGMMASGKPSLITGNMHSEVNTIIKESEGGTYFYKEDVTDIYSEIIKLKEDKNHCKKIGLNARNFITTKFSEENILSDFYSKIEKEINK